MKPEAAKQWVQALRSGKYRQGRTYLKIGDEFCCLGVLCDISGLHKWRGSWNNTFGDLFGPKDHSGEVLPPDVQEWAGMSSPQGDLDLDDDYGQTLAEMNDFGVPFAEIADIIEQNVEAL